MVADPARFAPSGDARRLTHQIMTRPVRTASTAPAAPALASGSVASNSPVKSRSKPPSKPPEPAARPSAPPPPPPNNRPSFRPGAPGSFLAGPQLPKPPAPDFKVGDKAVHPSHGVGEVTGLEEREIGGTRAKFYILRILDNGMKVMVPTSAATQVGLRYVMSDKEATDILLTMKAREVAVDVQPWSRRFRVYTEMIKSGSPTEIAKVLRDMNRLKFDKELSFGERRLLDQAKSLLLKELAIAKKKTEAEMAEEIAGIFSA
jgi:CarD family transcriptional regulator